MPAVSVIIPVYNAEHYLCKCVKSILCQSFTDFELILVDDGSDDNSSQICDDYASKDFRVRVFHKKNGGVSSARNHGIDEAKGKWIMFVDADDSLDVDAINVCFPFMNDYDIIRFSMNYVMKEDGSENHPFDIVDEPKDNYLSKIVSRKTILGVCGGLYRRSLFVKNNIRFDTNLVCGEDWVVLTALLANAINCKIINIPLYQYTKYNEKSCTASIKYENCLSTKRALGQIDKLLKDKYGDHSKFRHALLASKCRIMYSLLKSVILCYTKKLFIIFPTICKGQKKEGN